MSKVIVITSGKGGVGKTTSTANIGAGLAQMNKKVILVDTDIGLRKSGCRHGTGKPHHLQSGRRHRGKLPDPAGTDP